MVRLDKRKELSQNTILSYEKDLKSLLHFLTNYYGREINLEELQKINEEDLPGWFSKIKIVSRKEVTQGHCHQ